MKKGAAAISITLVIGAISTWCAGLSTIIFNDHSVLATVTAQVADFRERQSTIEKNQETEIKLLETIVGNRGLALATSTRE